MDPAIHKVDRFLRRPSIQGLFLTFGFLGSVASIFAWFGIGPMGMLGSLSSAARMIGVSCLFGFTLVAWLLGVYGLYRIYAENLAFRSCWEELHQINHYLRDEIAHISSAQPMEVKTLLEKERFALDRVCQLIANIFVHLTNKKCYACLSLVDARNGESYVYLWSKSQINSLRKGNHTLKLSENTRFFKANDCSPCRTSFFYSPNLLGEAEYQDALPEWKSFYNSTIVVPLRREKNERNQLTGRCKTG